MYTPTPSMVLAADKIAGYGLDGSCQSEGFFRARFAALHSARKKPSDCHPSSGLSLSAAKTIDSANLACFKGKFAKFAESMSAVSAKAPAKRVTVGGIFARGLSVAREHGKMPPTGRTRRVINLRTSWRIQRSLTVWVRWR